MQVWGSDAVAGGAGVGVGMRVGLTRTWAGVACGSSHGGRVGEWKVLTVLFTVLRCGRPVVPQDMSYMIKKLRSLIGDQTFLEAYERTGALRCCKCLHINKGILHSLMGRIAV